MLYCACAPLLCCLCPLCHHDMRGGGGAMARYAMQWFMHLCHLGVSGRWGQLASTHLHQDKAEHRYNIDEKK